jgi:ComEC/Rec2-related protein
MKEGYVSAVYDSSVLVKTQKCETLQLWGYCNTGKSPKVGVIVEIHKVERKEDRNFATLGKIREPVLLREPLLFGRYFGNTIKEAFYSKVLEKHGPDTSKISISLLFGGMVLPEWFKEVMNKLGLQHISAISGANIGLLGSIIEHTLRLRRKIMSYSILVVVGFLLLLLAGLLPPLVRAVVAVVLSTYFFIIGRNIGPLEYVTLPGIIGMILIPELSTSKSFYLALGAIFGLVVLFPQIESHVMSLIKKKDIKLHPYLINFIKIFLLQLSVAICIQPLLFLFFEATSLQGIISSIIFEPVFYVVLLLGYSSFLFSHLFPDTAILMFLPVKLIFALLKICFT